MHSTSPIDSTWMSLETDRVATFSMATPPASPQPEEAAVASANTSAARAGRRRRTDPTGDRPNIGTPAEERAAARAAARPSASARGRRAGLTGDLRDFAPLDGTRSLDPAENIKQTLMSRLTTYHWKRFVWLLRAREAFFAEGMALRRRPARWLGLMLAKEMSAIWGQLGGVTQALRGPRGAELHR